MTRPLDAPRHHDLPPHLRPPGPLAASLPATEPEGRRWSLVLTAGPGGLTITRVEGDDPPPGHPPLSTAPLPAAAVAAWLAEPDRLLGDVLSHPPDDPAILHLVACFDGLVGWAKDPDRPPG